MNSKNSNFVSTVGGNKQVLRFVVIFLLIKKLIKIDNAGKMSFSVIFENDLPRIW